MSLCRFLSAAGAGAALLLAALSDPASAAGSVHYYDGDARRTVTVQADLAAESARQGAGSPVRAAYAGAAVLADAGDNVVRIYRLPRVVSRSAAPAPAGLWPVYREGNSPAGRLMTLPGGVLVKFKPEWSASQVEAWLAARSLAAERKLAVAGNWYLVQTPAGAASLSTANTIFETGDVLSASPNWWKQTVSK